MRKNLLYIGNKLSAHGNTATSIEVLGKLFESEGYALRYASEKKHKLSRFAEMVWKTIRYGKSADYVLIDTYSTWNFWYAFAVGQICRLYGAKYVPILHGGNLPKRLRKNPVLCHMLFKHAYRNVAPSGYLLQAFETAGFDNVVRIPNPFEPTDFPFRQRTVIAPKLLWVRSFSPIYNPGMALKVIALLQKDFPDAALCMVGPDKGSFEKMKRISQSEKLPVTFTGKLSKPEWAALSKSYDIFVNTAHIDNTPFSVIEAAALGLAIVSTNVGGIPHLLKDRETALLVDDSDAEAMTAAIKELIANNELAQKLLSDSRRLVEESAWPSVSKKWAEILI